ncbi:Bromodomain-containing protein [Cucurbitaria berberidis CBS 394.84]|uniref:Bromodomain-containing protein n=1 Tax=Cucurbitaria berberidis CBS 394.84 TaxID=1168544 RepID=A0A9P4L3R0_9PLEO|nr:Bromodomain-containing protein [Cucurbitaria berberidis CBS 394.84]KAF1840562.1 Bromodomain-containing protein [Cucurbitaria berberidis CBS 394.84]
MESASKRKAASAAVGDHDSRPAKRQKGPAETNANSETAESTTTQGLKFLESLRQAKDKTGRPIAGHFLTLPNKSELPDYYVHIKLPIAIDTIEDKLNNGGYTSLAQVESDCKRLVNNAKAYNDKKSLIYEDAERLRKTASNWMVKHNPAYRDNNYVAVATPVPGEDNSLPGKPIPRIASTPRAVHTPVATPDTTERPRRAAAAAQSATPAPSKLRQSASAALEEDDDNPDFTGKTFQQAQEQILREIIDYEDGGLQIFVPFQNLPSRSLKDYYQLIKDPMSLTAVHKKIRGVVGREAPTGNTLLKSWNAFEDAMSLIWKNARIYNEDGSDIFNLSLELEEIFHKKLREAKAKVDEPPQPKLKLNMTSGAAAPKQQLKLKLRQSPGSDPNTPAARSSATPGIIVDSEALQRQQRHVLDSMKSNRSSRPVSAGKAGTPSAATNPFNGPRGGSATVAPLPAVQTRMAGSPPAVNGVKQDVQSPALSAIRPASTRSDSHDQHPSVPAQTPLPVMAPPHTMTRPASGSPHPNGISQQTGAYNTPYQPPSYYVPPAAPRVDSFRKVPLENFDGALIPKITLNTHPALNLSKPWSVDIMAHKQKTAHSVTIVTSPTNSYLQITPKVPIALTSRLYRLFVTVNGNRTLEVNRVPVTAGINGSSPGPGYDGGKKKGEPVFEAKLLGGVNRIEVELVAEKDRKGQPETGNAKDQIEIEKCTIFLHLMRLSSY